MKRRPVHRTFWILYTTFAALIFYTRALPSAEMTVQSGRATSNTKQLGTFMFSAVKDSREQLRSGVFEAFDSTERVDPKRGTFNSSGRIFCAFDYGRGLLRYDYESDVRRDTVRYFRTPDRSAVYTPETGYLTVMTPDGLSETSTFKPLDVRAVGFASLQELKNGWTFEKLYAFYTEQARLTDARKEANGQYRLIVSQMPNKSVVIERSIWVDSSRGYIPVRYQYRYLNRKTQKWSEPDTITETKWRKQSGIWVPQSIYATSGIRRKTVWNLRFVWKSVNSDVPDSLFQIAGIHAASGTVVVDNRLGKPIVTGKIGQDEQSEVDDLNSKSNSRPLFKIVVIANIVLLLVAGCGLLWYREKRRPK